MTSTSTQSAPVASPCIKICILDAAGVCKGCGRNLEEIAAWSRLAPEAQREIVEIAAQRRQLSSDRE